MRRFAAKVADRLGYEVRRRPVQVVRPRPEPLTQGSRTITDLSSFQEQTRHIRGMVTDESCKMLYALCYQQQMDGDVAEIGSWQGRSTVWLAQAVKDSGNGILHAVDHFKGNVGKEDHYRVENEDLSDLEEGFRRNVESVGLSDTVRLHNMRSEAAAAEIPDRSLRFLFIDGDHTEEGVRSDVRLFWSKLRPGGIVMFDDYATRFPGVVQVAQELVKKLDPPRAFAYYNEFVLMLPKRLPKRPPV